jgi:hypothetical protein
MSNQDLKSLIRTEFSERSARELLQLPATVLLGVTGSARDILLDLGVTTVFDLAFSRIFGAASQLTVTTGKTGDFLRFGTVPGGVLDAGTKSATPVNELQFQTIEILNGITAAETARIEKALSIKTVRDLALWPPYQAARKIANSVFNPDEEPGFDREAPSDLIPTAGQYPTERVVYNANFLIEVDGGSETLTEIADAGPIVLSGEPRLLTRPATGAILTFSQNWYPIGLSLGQLLYSLPLAPGESTKVAIIDFRRKTATSLSDDVSQAESLSNTLTSSRAISEVVNSVATEVQSGKSTINSSASSGSVGVAAGGLLPIGPVLGGATASGSTNSSNTTGTFSSKGRRDVSASMQQHISDSTQQKAFASRSLHAATVSEAAAEERESISTRTVSNYNHMHALTVQYYEVVQMYRTELRIEEARRLLFIPFSPLNFSDERTILRYRAALMNGVQEPYVRELLTDVSGFVQASVQLPRFGEFTPDPNDSAAEQAAARKDFEIAKAKTKAKEEMEAKAIQNKGIALRYDAAAGAWDLPSDASLIDLGWNGETSLIQRIVVGVESGADIEVNENGFNRNTTVNGDLGRAIPVTRLTSLTIHFTENASTRSQEFLMAFQVGNQSFRLRFKCLLPAGKKTARLVRFRVPVPVEELAPILNSDALYYSQIVWMNADPNELIMQMGSLSYKGKRVVDFIEPKPVAVFGNALGFIWNVENNKAWTEWKEKHASAPPKHDLVPLPTDGVFAEAVLGRFNSAEKLDMSRFWNWQDSPIPIQAPDIASIQAGEREGVAPATPGSLAAPVINLMTPRELPAPTGLAAALNALTVSNMFRDMSGAAQVAAANQAALQAAASGATSAGAQAGANMATFAQFEVEALKAIMPLLGAALGVPVAPSPGGTNISNAGAVANEAAKIDAAQVASSNGSGVGLVTAPPGGTGPTGAPGRDGVTGNPGRDGNAGRNGSSGRDGGNREEVVRNAAGLPPNPPLQNDKLDYQMSLHFLDKDGIPYPDGAFDFSLIMSFFELGSTIEYGGDAPLTIAEEGFFFPETITLTRRRKVKISIVATIGDAVVSQIHSFDLPDHPDIEFQCRMKSTVHKVSATDVHNAVNLAIDKAGVGLSVNSVWDLFLNAGIEFPIEVFKLNAEGGAKSKVIDVRAEYNKPPETTTTTTGNTTVTEYEVRLPVNGWDIVVI